MVKNLDRSLVVSKLGSNEVRKVTERLRGIKNVLHDRDSFLSGSNKFVFSLFNLDTGSNLTLRLCSFGSSLGSVKIEAGLVDICTGFCGEAERGVKGGSKGGIKPADNKRVLRQTGVANLSLSNGILFKSRSKRISRVTECLSTGSSSTAQSMVKGFVLLV